VSNGNGLALRPIADSLHLLHDHRGRSPSQDRANGSLSEPSGYHPQTREIDAVISTGAAVRRRDWDGEFDEVLGMKPANVRLARLNQGAAVLDSHYWHQGLSAMLGGIEPGSARISNGELTARINSRADQSWHNA